MPNGAKHWAFTLNNYTDDDIKAIEETYQSGEAVYVVFGKEVAASGTPHLQGHVQLKKRLTLKGVQKVVRFKAHLSMARNVQRSIDYCKKEGSFRELGTPPDVRNNSGKRSEFEDFRATIASGVTDGPTLRETHPNVMARYPHFAAAVIRDLAPPVSIPDHALRDWQHYVVEYTDREPDSRKILFIVDTVGNKGKSYLCDWLEKHRDNVQVMLPGKKADMAYQYQINTRVLIVDIPRTKVETFQYDVLEMIKNGRLDSPKYQSETKRFKPPHVVVMMNEEPNMKALSEDRYDLYVL